MRTLHVVVASALVWAACAEEQVEVARQPVMFDCRAPAQRLTCAPPAQAHKRYVCHANAHDYVKISVALHGAHSPGVAHGRGLADQAPGASALDTGGAALDCECRPRVCDDVCTGAGDGDGCDDGDPCTGDGTCDAGRCTIGTASCTAGEYVDACTRLTGACREAICATEEIACGDDADACTAESCDPILGCVHAPIACADDGNACTTETCDPILGCTSTPNALPCDDGDPSTTGDTCSNGTCAGTPACADFAIADTFERPDGDVLGPIWTEFQGDLDLVGGAAVMAGDATANSWARATQPQPASYRFSRLRFKVRLEDARNWVAVGFNAVQSSLHTSGIEVLLYGNGFPEANYLRLYEEGVLRAQLQPAGNLPDVDYYVTLTVIDSAATVEVRTDGYGGPVAYTLGPVALAGTAHADQLQLGLDHNGGAPPRLDEVSLESSCGCTDERVLTVGAAQHAIRLEGSVAGHVTLDAGSHTATVTGNATTGGGGVHPWVIARYPRAGGGGFGLLPLDRTSSLAFEEAGPLYGFVFDQWNAITFDDNGGVHTVATDGGTFTVDGVNNTFLLDDTVAARTSIPAGAWRVEVTGDPSYAPGRTFGRVMIGAYPEVSFGHSGHAMIELGGSFDFPSLGFGGDLAPDNVFAFFADYGDFSDNTGAATLRFCRQ